jgi:hypothetical protein
MVNCYLWFLVRFQAPISDRKHAKTVKKLWAAFGSTHRTEHDRDEGPNQGATYIPSDSWREGHFSSLLFPRPSSHPAATTNSVLFLLSGPAPSIGIEAMDPPEVPPTADQVPRPQMVAPASSAAPVTPTALSGSTREEEEARGHAPGQRCYRHSCAAPSPAPVVASPGTTLRAPQLKSVLAS